MEKEKGVIIYFAMVLLSVILIAGIIISFLLVSQAKTIKKIGYSVTAFHVADSGIEWALYEVYKSNKPDGNYSGFLDINLDESIPAPENTCPDNLPANSPDGCYKVHIGMEETPSHIDSVGFFMGTRRAISVTFNP